jgi:hypothetical protein
VIATPNYFGEIIMQFSIFMIALSPSAYGYIPSGSGTYAAQYSAILGAIFLTYTAHVRIRFDTTGAAWRQEAVRN